MLCYEGRVYLVDMAESEGGIPRLFMDAFHARHEGDFLHERRLLTLGLCHVAGISHAKLTGVVRPLFEPMRAPLGIKPNVQLLTTPTDAYKVGPAHAHARWGGGRALTRPGPLRC
jgi:hypothetical protein